jgi:hypothetical protein
VISRWRKSYNHAQSNTFWRNRHDGAAELPKIDPLGSWVNSGEGICFAQPATMRQATDSSDRVAASIREVGNRMIKIKRLRLASSLVAPPHR